MKNLLIVTGPQGSGNHLFSKIFAKSQNIFGWQELNDTYWVPHDKEPFAEAWHDVSLLEHVQFNEYAVTSISCPYAYHGVTIEPDYSSFINKATELGYNVRLAIIGRDQNILKYQQERVRGTHSYHRFEQHLDYLMTFNPVFLSTELLYLYKGYYVKQISKLLDVPIDITDEEIKEILQQDSNSKYLKHIEAQPLDNYVKKVSGLL
jgi:hypothetical protein